MNEKYPVMSNKKNDIIEIFPIFITNYKFKVLFSMNLIQILAHSLKDKLSM